MTNVAETLRLRQGDGTTRLPSQPLACVRDGAIAHVVISRPAKRNALPAQIWRELPPTMGRLAEDRAVRLVVLRGAGAAAFSHQSLVVAKATVNSIAGPHARPDAELDRLFEGSFQSRDFKENCAAFMEKRRPRFE